MQRVVRACQLNFFRWLQFSKSIFLLRLERKHVACLMDQGELWNCNMLTSFICFPCCVLPVRKTNPNTRGLVWDLQTCWSCVVHTCIFINDNAWWKHESTAKQKRWYHSTAFQHEALFASSTESGACLVHRHLGSFWVRSLTLLICLTSQISLKKRHCEAGKIRRWMHWSWWPKAL